MRDKKWLKQLEDGRTVEFTYEGLPQEGIFLIAQLERNEVVYSIVLAKAKNPFSLEDVESRFWNELEKK
jgi:hypothetical protein